jgi:protein involved in polysaccharide export with SLBB domain
MSLSRWKFSFTVAALWFGMMAPAAMVSAEGGAPAVGAAPGVGISVPLAGMAAPQAGTALPGTATPSALQAGTVQGAQDISPSPSADKPASVAGKEQAATSEGDTNNDTSDETALQKQRTGRGKSSVGGAMSSIEQTLRNSPTGTDKAVPGTFSLAGLTQFGYSYFKPETQTFEPLTDIPVGPDYPLGAGDRISLTVWGSFDGHFDLPVNRSGEIILPKVGPLKVAGVTFGKLPSLINGSLSRVFKDFHTNVTMGKLRLMKVFVVGEVNAPGDYSLSSLSTVINALSAANGPTKNGSLRTIQVKRDGKTAATVDLYDFFTKGDKSCDIRLQPGDTIFVPPIGAVAGIAGNVRRPGIYEIKDEKNLKDLVALAGGVTSSGYLHRLQIARIVAHEKKIVTDLSIDPKIDGKSLDDIAAGLPIQDMDLVKIFPIDGILRNYVRMDGYVLRPGDYALKPGLRLSQVLADASLLPEYYADAGQIVRIFPPDNHQEIVSFNVAKAVGGDPAHDLLLQEFDKIMVYSRWEMEEVPTVRIYGEVQKPGQYRLFDRMTLRDLVIQAGNPKKTAFLKHAEIVRVSNSGESVVATPIYVNLEEALKGNEKNNIALQPFDDVIIKRIPNWREVTDSYVTLKGEFVYPGIYPVYKGEKLSSVIRRAGGYTDKAYFKGAKFTREQIRQIQQKRLEEVLVREEANIAQKQSELASTSLSTEELQATKASLDGLKKSIAMLKGKRAEGRMVISLLSEHEFTESEFDFEVQAGDVLEVPADPRVVSVFGQVYNPNSYHFVAGESVENYLAKSGGFTRDAEEGDVYVIKADGSVVSRQMSSGFLFLGSFMNKELDSGDTVVVPQRMEKVAWLRDIKDITTIISQIAVSVGIVFAAGL